MQLTIPSIAEPLTLRPLDFTAHVLAPLTSHYYAHWWKLFSAWCAGHQLIDLPASPETVARYVTDLLNRRRKISTAERYLDAIRYRHRCAGYPSPCGAEIRRLLYGAKRLLGIRLEPKEPIRVEHLRELCVDTPQTTTEIRDRSILLFGFASALRRSNIAALDISHIDVTIEGAVVQIGREKQDQTGIGRVLGIPRGHQAATCPVSALETWLACRGPEPGPLFPRMVGRRVSTVRLNPDRISQIVKLAVGKLGLDPLAYGGHSLRAGFVTASFEAGVGEVLIARHTGHRSIATLKRYLRSRDPFKANACAALNL